jgi:hypothetical protein
MGDADIQNQPAVAGVPRLGSALSEGRSLGLDSKLWAVKSETRLFPQTKA